MSELEGGFIGRPMPRREDHRLLTGGGQFIADLMLPGMLRAAFVRSAAAHARIRSVDLSRARAAPGVVYAIAGPELMELLPPVPDTQLSLPRKWTAQVQHTLLNPQQPLLAHDKVRHVGEAVAVVPAGSRYRAEDGRPGHSRSRAAFCSRHGKPRCRMRAPFFMSGTAPT